MSKDSKLLRLDLPADVWDELDKRAVERGLKVGVYAKQVLLNHLGHGRPSDREVSEPRIPAHPVLKEPGTPRITKAQWAAVQKWLAATDRTPPPGVTTKSGCYAWAQTQGFKP